MEQGFVGYVLSHTDAKPDTGVCGDSRRSATRVVDYSPQPGVCGDSRRSATRVVTHPNPAVVTARCVGYHPVVAISPPSKPFRRHLLQVFSLTPGLAGREITNIQFTYGVGTDEVLSL